MSRRFRLGLVVGKFSPLHLGHESLIRHARATCDDVLVLSYSQPEHPHCDAASRERWLKARFPGLTAVVIDGIRLDRLCQTRGAAPRTLPPNDAPDDVQRDFVAWLCLEVLDRRVDAVFTSEDYGEGFAASMQAHLRASGLPKWTVTHVSHDPDRAALPISGTRLRQDPHAGRRYLAPEVYADFVERVCLLGGESSGKTTLAEALSNRLATGLAAEYGRELWVRRNGALSEQDLLDIARVQIQREDDLARSANHWLICDTSPLTTLLYAQAMFGEAAPELQALAARPYHHTFVCAPDFPFVQDGTRRDEAFRRQQHAWYVEQLDRRGIAYVLLSGPLDVRLEQALTCLRTGPPRLDADAQSAFPGIR